VAVQIPCRDCAEKEQNKKGNGRVLDVSSLLSIKGRQDEVGYYCNCGPTDFGMDDDHEYKVALTCDMILCMGCYCERTNKMSRDGGGRRKRTKRNRYKD
jgi:hypothetical protein